MLNQMQICYERFLNLKEYFVILSCIIEMFKDHSFELFTHNYYHFPFFQWLPFAKIVKCTKNIFLCDHTMNCSLFQIGLALFCDDSMINKDNQRCCYHHDWNSWHVKNECFTVCVVVVGLVIYGLLTATWNGINLNNCVTCHIPH